MIVSANRDTAELFATNLLLIQESEFNQDL